MFHGGHAIVPIGGLAGNLPKPSVEKLAAILERGDFRIVLAVPSADARYAWITSRCTLRRRFVRAELYECGPPRARGPRSQRGAP